MTDLEKLMPRCKTKDTDDFKGPEELGRDERCFNCRAWEAIDQRCKEAEKVGRDIGIRLERSRTVLNEGQLNQELNEIRNALKVLVEFQEEGK